MTTKIESKIVGYEVVKPGNGKPAEELQPQAVLPAIAMRPPTLPGMTYKLKGPTMPDAVYVTFNDMDGQPYEMFINSKDTQHSQWTAALTRLVSALFRANVSPLVVVEELRAIKDTGDGVGFVQLVGMEKPKFVQSIPQAIGYLLEYHLKSGGSAGSDAAPIVEPSTAHDSGQPEGAGAPTKCKACGEDAVVMLDGCPTCSACGDSKCG